MQALLSLTHQEHSCLGAFVLVSPAWSVPQPGNRVMAFPLPSFGSLLECHHLAKACPDPLLPPSQDSSVLTFLHSTCHHVTHSIYFLLDLFICLRNRRNAP